MKDIIKSIEDAQLKPEVDSLRVRLLSESKTESLKMLTGLLQQLLQPIDRFGESSCFFFLNNDNFSSAFTFSRKSVWKNRASINTRPGLL